MIRRQKIFSWRFVAMFAVILLVSIAAYAFVRRVNQTDALVDTAQQAVRTSARQADELAELRAADKRQQVITDRRSEVASRERDQLLRQVRQLQKQLTTLTTYLREHNISVPFSVNRPRAGSSTRPKAPHRPTSRGTPTPTEPSPSPDPAPPCVLPPPLPCALPLPTALPTLLPKD